MLAFELAESLADPQTITVVEWGETIGAVLPDDRIIVTISPQPEGDGREVTIAMPSNYDDEEGTV